MKTIKSIEWRASIKALRKIKQEIIETIEKEIAVLEMGIENEELNGNLPDDVE